MDGVQLAREALARAREAAKATRTETERAAAGRRRAATRAANVAPRREPTAEGDPVTFGAAIDDLLAVRGWQGEARVAQVTANWPATVGEDLAAHCRPVTLREGVLTVEAESTAWATQIRLLAPRLLARIAEVAGAGVVTRLAVHGPAGPSWRHGRLRVPGRGPRDTYG
jgi:predicted nucleic acid-binding Zn ribbon protein